MSEKHLRLSEFIKLVHEKLRINSRLLGEEKAWEEHCKDEETLKKYASSMRELAENFWDNNSKLNARVISRIFWTMDFCLRYFLAGGIDYQRQKEKEIWKKFNSNDELVNFEGRKNSGKLKLLDVGSCYDAFKPFDEVFDVTGLDIAPASPTVYKCDFLNLKIGSRKVDYTERKIVAELEKNKWDIIVFSLFLEYLPSPKQRKTCCEKAYDLLKEEGVLVVISPDSKHVGANSKIMKSWRFILAKLGLSRIKYEKLPHLHCMVFRKSIKKEIAARWADLQNSDQFYEEMFIPQDFKQVNDSAGYYKTSPTALWDLELFEALPFGEI